MKIILIGSKNQFKAGSGNGIDRYSYELYNFLRLQNFISINKLEIGLENKIMQKFSFLNNIYFYFAFKNKRNRLKNYDILHNLDANKPISKSKFITVTISTVHDLIPFDKDVMINGYKNTSNFGLRYVMKIDFYINYLVMANSLKKSIESSDYIITNSTQTKGEVRKFGFDKKKIFVVNLGIDKRFSKNKTEFNNKPNKFVVGYIGALSFRKNIDMIINAAGKLNNKQDVFFRIYGRILIESNYLINRVANLKNVQFMGFAPEDKLVEIYDSFDIFVFPSLYEGFGLPILEAQARGLPVIIYKYSKIPKEVRKYCFEAESPEHMTQIIEDLKENGYNGKLKKKATEYARSFTWEKTAKETLEVYKKVLK